MSDQRLEEQRRRALADSPLMRLKEEDMSEAQWHLAQVNIGRARGAIDGPIMAEFVARLADINALAEQTPGFVWRLQTEDGDATAIRPYADERIMINLSVWADLESLREFVFRSAHAAVMRRRREWFERFEGIYVALWWVPSGHRPTTQEAVSRLAHLEANGPTAFAFSFQQPFDAEGRAIARDRTTWEDACPA
jgi:heme-degrading monooxygenase HmoA